MGKIHHCELHDIDYLVYCHRCEIEFRESGLYQKFLDKQLGRRKFRARKRDA